MLTREAFLSADDLARERVDLPEMGEGAYVYVRVMTAGERDRYEQEVLKFGEGDLEDIRARLAVYTVCDEAGAALFTPADVPAVSAKCAPALDRIFTVAVRLNRISKADVAELVKNSAAGP